MERSDSINELALALSKAQGALRGALKDSANPFFKSRYADLASVWEACREALAANGLAVIQSPSAQTQVVTVETLLTHASGQWVQGSVSCVAKDDGPQAVGSAITYLRRYALQSFVGVAPEDDDAERAQGRGNAPVREEKPAPVGYREWLVDLESTADMGEVALTAAWKASKPEFRAHLPANVKEALKKRAAQVPA